ncbi:hypothetical protein I3W98_39990, partial [Streptomyces cavourensis]|nr:hypothetical protein [Streptomyces cavourensis]
MASSSAAAAPRRRAVSPAPSLTGPADDVHPVLRRTTAPPAALDLLAKPRGLDEAAVLPEPNERYATAHLMRHWMLEAVPDPEAERIL